MFGEETARLRHTSRHCPAGTMPFIFGGGFHCVPITGMNGLGASSFTDQLTGWPYFWPLVAGGLLFYLIRKH